MKILDATCGFRGIWYQKNHPFVTFLDKRKVKCIESRHPIGKKRRVSIDPDVVSTWKDASFPDNYFDMIIFDPPHLIVDRSKKKFSTMEMLYGVLYKDNWKHEIKEGVKKLFRILKPNGIFVLKWCEHGGKIEDVIKLMPYPPLFGSNTKSKGHTSNYWILFLKYDVNIKLDKIQT